MHIYFVYFTFYLCYLLGPIVVIPFVFICDPFCVHSFLSQVILRNYKLYYVIILRKYYVITNWNPWCLHTSYCRRGIFGHNNTYVTRHEKIGLMGTLTFTINYFHNLKFNNFLHEHGIFIKFLLLVHQWVVNIMQLTDFQYLLPRRKSVILCKQVCFVPKSPIFSCLVTYHNYNVT